MTETEKERQAVKKTFKGEMNKLKDMKFTEKCDYIWEYYKAPILIFLCAALLIGSLIHHYITRKTDVLFGVVVDATCYMGDQLTEDLNSYLQVGDKETVFVENNLYLRNSANFEAETKITCYIAAGNIDFAFGDFDMMENFGKQGILKDLKSYLPADLYDYFKDDIITYTFTNDDTGESYSQTYLKLDNYQFFDKYQFSMRKEGDSFYLGVAVVSPNTDNTIKLFEYIQSLGRK